MIFNFYKFATYSIPMNLIAVPIMSFFIMPIAIAGLIAMPMHIDWYLFKLLGFFVQIVIESAKYVVSLPYAIWYVGHITPLSIMLFSFGFFWICLWQTRWRLIGLLIMSISLLIMNYTPRPDLIYDDKYKAIAIKNREGKLEIYTNDKIPQFTVDFWANWYGQADAKIIKRKIMFTDLEFMTDSGKKIALSYWQCPYDANVIIIPSKKLDCGDVLASGQLIINRQKLDELKVITIYCGKVGQCYFR